MDTKLTLKMDKRLIERAKKYAKRHNTSLSRLVENFLLAITKENDKEISVLPEVKKLTGVIRLVDDDYKKDYARYLTKKYE